MSKFFNKIYCLYPETYDFDKKSLHVMGNKKNVSSEELFSKLKDLNIDIESNPQLKNSLFSYSKLDGDDKTFSEAEVRTILTTVDAEKVSDAQSYKYTLKSEYKGKSLDTFTDADKKLIYDVNQKQILENEINDLHIDENSSAKMIKCKDNQYAKYKRLANSDNDKDLKAAKTLEGRYPEFKNSEYMTYKTYSELKASKNQNNSQKALLADYEKNNNLIINKDVIFKNEEKLKKLNTQIISEKVKAYKNLPKNEQIDRKLDGSSQSYQGNCVFLANLYTKTGRTFVENNGKPITTNGEISGYKYNVKGKEYTVALNEMFSNKMREENGFSNTPESVINGDFDVLGAGVAVSKYLKDENYNTSKNAMTDNLTSFKETKEYNMLNILSAEDNVSIIKFDDGYKPLKDRSLEEKSMFDKMLSDASSKGSNNFSMTIGCSDENKGFHDYTVTDVQKSSEGKTIITVRNPHGFEETWNKEDAMGKAYSVTYLNSSK